MTPWHSDSARTENLLSQFHRSDRVPSTRKISPSLLKSDRVFAYSHRVQVRDRGIIFLAECFVGNSPTHRVHCRPPSPLPPLPSTESTTVHRVTGLLTEWLFFSPSVWSETHRVTESTESTESRVFSPSPRPSEFPWVRGSNENEMK